MADLPDNSPKPFQLPGPAVPWHGNSWESVSNAVNTGMDIASKRAQMNYIGSQTRSQDLINQYLPLTTQLKQQEMAMKMQEQTAKIQKDKADAINGVGQIAPLLKLLPMKNAKELLSSHLQKIQGVFGDIPVDPKLITDDNIDEVEQWAKGRPEIEAKGSPDALTSYDAMWMSKMGETQRDIVKGISPVTPTEQFNQGNESQRASAGATAPLVGSAYSVNLAKTALSKGDELNDHIAINEFGKLMNNGTSVPLPELQKMAASGTWGPKFAQAFSKFTGEGALSPEQRTMMQSALNTLGESLQGQAQTRTAQYPGAKPPTMPITKVIQGGQLKGKTAISTDGGRTWALQ